MAVAKSPAKVGLAPGVGAILTATPDFAVAQPPGHWQAKSPAASWKHNRDIHDKTAAMGIHIRPAALDDAPAICAVHCSNITQWRQWGADGASRPARYADLTPYQRWINGGPWLDPETCAHHLQRRFQGGGIVLVAELPAGGRVLAEAELFVADEPPPYGRNLNLAVLYVHRNHHGQGLGSALMEHTLALAQSEGCDTYTVAHAEAPDFYRRHGLRRTERWVRYVVSTHTRRRAAQYWTRRLPDAPYDSVRGWAMPLGRYQNAHHDWERVRPGAVPDFKEWRHLRHARYRLKSGPTRIVAIFEETPSSVDVANTFAFVQGGSFDDTLFNAIRNLAGRLGFTRLQCFARADSRLPDAAATAYTHNLFMKRLR